MATRAALKSGSTIELKSRAPLVVVNVGVFFRRRRRHGGAPGSGAEGDRGVGAQQKLVSPEEPGPVAVGRALRLAERHPLAGAVAHVRW
jgi:hypothetical protein